MVSLTPFLIVHKQCILPLVCSSPSMRSYLAIPSYHGILLCFYFFFPQYNALIGYCIFCKALVTLWMQIYKKGGKDVLELHLIVTCYVTQCLTCDSVAM